MEQPDLDILLHTCCAPCSLTVARGFEGDGHRVTSFFHNPNIHPYTEYKARLDSLREFAATTPNRGLIVSERYGMEDFFRAVAMAPAERCTKCYRIRLMETAKTAADGGFGGFSTTLLVSPYQNQELIRSAGEQAAAVHGVPFVHRDFRDTFRAGQTEAKELGLYRQKHCGCLYSEMERYTKGKAE